MNQISGGFNRIFDYITSQGTGSCLSAAFGIPGANLGGLSCGLTSVEMTTYWSLGDRGYSPRYEGNPAARDRAYHQGTVWPWLMGAFVEAWIRVRDNTRASRIEARDRFVRPLVGEPCGL